MRDATLYSAYEARYLAEFRWIKAALHIPPTKGAASGRGKAGPVLISPARRTFIYERDQGRCYLCGLPVEADLHEGPWACTIDHVRPLSHHGARKATSNLELAHLQCNQIKGSAPHPRTIYETDSWRCQRCLTDVSQGPEWQDWHWNRPLIEHLVPLDSPDMWWYGRCWTCHGRCHNYHHPIPQTVLARSNVLASNLLQL